MADASSAAISAFHSDLLQKTLNWKTNKLTIVFISFHILVEVDTESKNVFAHVFVKKRKTLYRRGKIHVNSGKTNL